MNDLSLALNTLTSKAARQAYKRSINQGARVARQRSERREGPNVRVRVCKVSGSPFMGYSYMRLRDGKMIGEAK